MLFLLRHSALSKIFITFIVQETLNIVPFMASFKGYTVPFSFQKGVNHVNSVLYDKG